MKFKKHLFILIFLFTIILLPSPLFAQSSESLYSDTIDYSGFYYNPAYYAFDDNIFSVLVLNNQSFKSIDFNILNVFEFQFNGNQLLNFDMNLNLFYKSIFKPAALGIKLKHLFRNFDVDFGIYSRFNKLFHFGFVASDLINNRNYSILAGFHFFDLITISAMGKIYESNFSNINLDNIYYKFILDFNLNDLYLSISYDSNGTINFSINFFEAIIGTYAKLNDYKISNTSFENIGNYISYGGSIKLVPRKSADYQKIYIIDLEKYKFDSRLLLFLNKQLKSTHKNIFVLKLGAGLSSFYQVEDLLYVLKKLKEKGNYIIAYLSNANLLTLTAGSIADRILMNPVDLMSISGISMSKLFFKDFLEKYGITPIVIKSGKYKSAGDSFINNSFSEADREQYSLYLTRVLNYLIGEISKNRKISKEQIIEIINQYGYLNSEQAKKLNLVDDLLYSFELKKYVNKFSYSKFKKYLPITSPYIYTYHEDQWKEKKGFAIVYLKGQIVDYYKPSAFDNTSYIITPDNTIPVLDMLINQPSIKYVLLIIDSPGGSAKASDMIFAKIKELQKKKKLWVLQNSVAASGGYYLSIGSKKIYSHKTTLTGSIGVISVFISIKKLLEKYGIHYDEIKLGKFSTAGSSFKDMTEEEKKMFEKVLKWFLYKFESKVAKSRNMSINEVRKVAQGRVWSGIDALKNKLVDGTLSFLELMNKIFKENNIDENDIIFFIMYPTAIRYSMFDFFLKFETFIKNFNNIVNLGFFNPFRFQELKIEF